MCTYTVVLCGECGMPMLRWMQDRCQAHNELVGRRWDGSTRPCAAGQEQEDVELSKFICLDCANELKEMGELHYPSTGISEATDSD